jgi:hypothetical protein
MTDLPEILETAVTDAIKKVNSDQRVLDPLDMDEGELYGHVATVTVLRELVKHIDAHRQVSPKQLLWIADQLESHGHDV